jgi:hypothetical protein
MRIPKALSDWSARQHVELEAMTPALVSSAAAATGLPSAKINILVDRARRSNQLAGGSAHQEAVAQQDVYAANTNPVVSATVGGKQVTGQMLGSWVDIRGHARAQIRFTGVSVRNLVDMFTKEDVRAFFPTARSYFRHATDDGGQAMLENPLLGPPVMYSHVTPEAETRSTDGRVEGGLHSTFVGLVHGGSHLDISEDGKGGVLLDEDTTVSPALSDIPGEKLLESVPFFGAFQWMGRATMEYVGGAAMAAIHEALVPQLALNAMVETLAKRAADEG